MQRPHSSSLFKALKTNRMESRDGEDLGTIDRERDGECYNLLSLYQWWIITDAQKAAGQQVQDLRLWWMGGALYSDRAGVKRALLICGQVLES